MEVAAIIFEVKWLTVKEQSTVALVRVREDNTELININKQD